ncbi:MAG: carboxypeptidase-like regulatory domain-containing protein [Thermodesulfovibrionales bacterium]
MRAIIKIIVIFILLQGCTYAVRYDSDYRGRVIDADTGEPIEGMVVLGTWYNEYSGVAGAVHTFYDARETVTDKNGEFSIPGIGITNVTPMDILIFKTGYEYDSGSWEGLKKSSFYKKKIKWEGNKAIIPLRKLTMEERKKQLGNFSPPGEAPKEKVILMLKEIEKDNKELAPHFKGRVPWGGKPLIQSP